MNKEFNLFEIEKTFSTYKKGELYDGVVILKNNDGVIFNIGGKKDAFIPKEDFENFEDVKIGDRFKVTIVGASDEGLILASKTEADIRILGTQNALKLKLGSRFTFVVNEFKDGLKSKMGDYKIFIPKSEISDHKIDFKSFIGSQQEAVVTEINRDDKTIIASIKLLAQQIKQTNEDMFWKSIFINKIVKGKVKKIMPYGAFINVDGVDCFIHISDLSYEKITEPSQIIKEGDELNFKVIDVDRENKKIKLGLKQILPDPLEEKIEALSFDRSYNGEVVKILPFGAVIRLDNGVFGLLHISSITDRCDANVYEFVKLNQKVIVKILSKDVKNKKISFALCI